MRTKIRSLTPLLAAAGACAAIVLAPVAAATPRCTTVAPNTTQCETNGSSAIVNLTPAEQLLRRLAVGRWPGARHRRLGLGW